MDVIIVCLIRNASNNAVTFLSIVGEALKFLAFFLVGIKAGDLGKHCRECLPYSC